MVDVFLQLTGNITGGLMDMARKTHGGRLVAAPRWVRGAYYVMWSTGCILAALLLTGAVFVIFALVAGAILEAVRD